MTQNLQQSNASLFSISSDNPFDFNNNLNQPEITDFNNQPMSPMSQQIYNPFACPPGLNVGAKSMNTLPSYQNQPPSEQQKDSKLCFSAQPVQMQQQAPKKKTFCLSEKPTPAQVSEKEIMPIQPLEPLQFVPALQVRSKLSVGMEDKAFDSKNSSQTVIPSFQPSLFIQQVCPLSQQQLQVLNSNLITQGCSSKSRIIQQQIEELYNSNSIQQIDNAVIANMTCMHQLTEDKYGNYLMQLLIRYCSQSIFEQLLDILSQSIEQFSFNQYSCRVIQLAVERCGQCNIPQFVFLVYSTLTKSHSITVRASNSQFASHILLVCLQQMSIQSFQGYVLQVANCYLQIAQDQYGCRILEYVYKRVDSKGAHDIMQPVYQTLVENATKLAGHKFGNYLVQAALRNKYYQSAQLDVRIQADLMQHFAELAMSKYGSNICECLIQVTDFQFLLKLTTYLAKEHLVTQMVADQFGNFIIQMILQKFSDSSEQCDCKKCAASGKIFGEQEEVSEDVVIEGGNFQVKERMCRKIVFEKFGGVVKLILEDIQNVHVERCLVKFLDFDNLEEYDEDYYCKFVQ